MAAKLKCAEDHNFFFCGCVFLLDDGRNVRLEVCYDDIDKYLTENGFPSLTVVAQSGKSDVYSLPIRMLSTEWGTISRILTNSEQVKSTFADFPFLSVRIQLSFDEIASLPQRLYGGVGEPVPGVAPTFYLSHPIDFTTPHDRDDSWRYALLSHRGGHLFKTFVNIHRNAVEIEQGIVEYHFLERRMDVDSDP